MAGIMKSVTRVLIVFSLFGPGMEQPDLPAQDVRAFFRKAREGR